MTQSKYNLTVTKVKGWLETMSVSQIANDLGCCPTSIYHFCRKHNIQLPQLNLVGKKWGWLEVVESAGSNGKQKLWKCKCKCGNHRLLPTCTITAEKQQSCGCWLTSEERKRRSSNWKGYRQIHGKYWYNIQKGAKQRGYIFEISIQYAWQLYVQQNKLCALTQQPIVFANTIREVETGGTTASLDRIDNSKGYIEDNVWWVHKDINLMKQKFSKQYFIDLCKLVAENN